MIVLEDEERLGDRMARAQDREPQMPADNELRSAPLAWAPHGGDRIALGEEWWCPEEEWSYDLFDLQDTGLVPLY